MNKWLWSVFFALLAVPASGQTFLSNNGTFVAIPAATQIIQPSGTFSDFVHDDAPAIQTALNTASTNGGGWVTLNPAQPYWAQTALIVPPGVTLGCLSSPQKQLNTGTYVSLPCSVYLAPNNPITNQGNIVNARIYQDNIHFAGNPTTPHQLRTIVNNYSTTGTGIISTAVDAIIQDVSLTGFNLCIQDNSLNRGSLRNILCEGANGIKAGTIGDYLKGQNIEIWPFYSTNRSISTQVSAITAVADNGSGAWRVTLNAAPADPLVTGDEIFIGGNGSITIPQGALGRHNITVIDTTHFDLTGSQDAPVVSIATTTGLPYVTGLSSTANLWPGMTFTGTCFTGTRTLKALYPGVLAFFADGNATTTGSCTLTFASQVFAATGTPQAIFDARGGQHGVGLEIVGAGILYNNVFVWCHDTALQIDAGSFTDAIDLFSVDCNGSEYRSERIGISFGAGAIWNRITGNSQTSGGVAVLNQSGSSAANIVSLGRVGGWTWGSVENDSGTLIVSGTTDVDNAAAAGQFNPDTFTLSTNALIFANGSQFTSAAARNSTGTTQSFTIDSGSRVGTLVQTPLQMTLGSAGSTGTLSLNGSGSGSATVNVSSAGALQFSNNTAGQSMLFNNGGSGVMFTIQNNAVWPGPVAIASLPTCSGSVLGAHATVNNGVAPIAWNTAVSTTGAATWPVHCTGSGWTYD